MMKQEELEGIQAPFKAFYQGKGKAHEVTGFTQNDPLGVGGGFFPDQPTVHFKTGFWLLLPDFLENYELATS